MLKKYLLQKAISSRMKRLKLKTLQNIHFLSQAIQNELNFSAQLNKEFSAEMYNPLK